MVPQNSVKLTEAKAVQMLKLMDALEDSTTCRRSMPISILPTRFSAVSPEADKDYRERVACQVLAGR